MQGKLKKNRKSAQVCSGNKRALRDSSKQQLWLRAARAAVSWQQEHEAVEALNTSGSIFCNGSIFIVIPNLSELSLCATIITATAEQIFSFGQIPRDRKLK